MLRTPSRIVPCSDIMAVSTARNNAIPFRSTTIVLETCEQMRDRRRLLGTTDTVAKAPLESVVG
jgi:hypothetical protein